MGLKFERLWLKINVFDQKFKRFSIKINSLWQRIEICEQNRIFILKLFDLKLHISNNA